MLNREIMTNNIPEIVAGVGLAMGFNTFWIDLPENLAPVVAILGIFMLIVTGANKALDFYIKFKHRNDDDNGKKKTKH